MAVTENDLIVGPVVVPLGVDTISVDFYVEDASWLEVYKSGSETALVLDTDYTFAGEGTDSGVVTLTTASDGSAYSVYLTVPLRRSSDLQFRGDLRSGPFNLELDRLWQALQGVKTIAQRTIILAKTSPALPPLTFDIGADTDDRAIVFDPTSSALVPGPTATEVAAAQGYAEAASDDADAAAASATAASGSASAASTSETNAASSASAAASSASAASTSETNAGNSATAAAGSASAASTSETNAASSASAAATSETNAGDSETAAATSASNASTSETNAATSEAKAEDWAEEDEDVEVETGKYSAKHYAAKAAATVPGMVVLQREVISNDADVKLTALDGSLYDIHKIFLSNVIPATDDVRLYARTSSDSINYDDGASDYSYANSQIGGNNSAVSNASTAMILTNIGTGNEVGSAAGEDGVSMEITIFGAHLSRKTNFSWEGGFIASNGNPQTLKGGGHRLASEAVTAVQILASTGLLESGTITLCGIRNA